MHWESVPSSLEPWGANAPSCNFRVAGFYFPWLSPAIKLQGAPLLTTMSLTLVLSETAIFKRPSALSGLHTHLCHLFMELFPNNAAVAQETLSQLIGK